MKKLLVIFLSIISIQVALAEEGTFVDTVPAIVTLFQEELNFIDKVPIIPIIQFSSFVDEFYGNLDDLKTIET